MLILFNPLTKLTLSRCTPWWRVCSRQRGPCARKCVSGRRRQQRQRGGRRRSAPRGRAGRRGAGGRRERRARAPGPRGGAGPERKRGPPGRRPPLAAAALAGARPAGQPAPPLTMSAGRARAVPPGCSSGPPSCVCADSPSMARAGLQPHLFCLPRIVYVLDSLWTHWVSGAGTGGAAGLPHPAGIQPSAVLDAEQQPGRGVGGARPSRADCAVAARRVAPGERRRRQPGARPRQRR